MSRRRPQRRRIAGLILASVLCLSCSGCTESGQLAVDDMISNILELSFSTPLQVSSTDWYYAYRRDMHPGSYAGEPVLDLGDPSFTLRDLSAPGLYASPVIETAGLGRLKSVTVLLDGPMDSSSPDQVDPELPGWAHNRTYPGILPGDLYRQVRALDSSAGRVLITYYAWTAGLGPALDIISGYLALAPDTGILCRMTAVYDGFSLVPAGFILEYQALDGGLSGCRYVYNVQPGIGIDYGTGRSWIGAGGDPEAEQPGTSENSGEDGADG